MMKHLAYLIVIVLLWSCESEDSLNTGGTNTPTPSTSFYTHDREIKSFIVNFDEIAIIDDNGLTIVNNGQAELFETVTYNVLDQSFTAQLNDVYDMISNGDELYIGTTDGHLIKYKDGEFLGFPIRVLSLKRFFQNQQIQALWEWHRDDLPVAFPSGIFRTEIELDGESLLVRDEWPCLNALNPVDNLCDSYDLTDFASLERYAMVGNNGQLLTLPDYANNGIYEYRPDFSQLPFSRFKQLELFYHASGFGDPPDKFYFDHIWVNTDNGLAYYLMEENEDIVFETEQWNHLSKENSDLSSNRIEEVRVLKSERLIAYSNNPPSIYYINAEDGSLCSFSAPTTGEITQVYVDFYDLYVAQGTEIYEVKSADLQTECGY